MILIQTIALILLAQGLVNIGNWIWILFGLAVTLKLIDNLNKDTKK